MGKSPEPSTDGGNTLKGRVALATLYHAGFQPKVLGQTGFVRAHSRSRLFCGAQTDMIGWNGDIMVFRQDPM